jgi:AbrB family looped-hinge helix DNA binding protein
MRTTIDSAGRIVVPKPLRDELGLTGGTELDLRAVDGRLEISIPPARVSLQDGPHGPRFVSQDALQALTAETVLDVLDAVRDRRL